MNTCWDGCVSIAYCIQDEAEKENVQDCVVVLFLIFFFSFGYWPVNTWPCVASVCFVGSAFSSCFVAFVDDPCDCPIYRECCCKSFFVGVCFFVVVEMEETCGVWANTIMEGINISVNKRLASWYSNINYIYIQTCNSTTYCIQYVYYNITSFGTQVFITLLAFTQTKYHHKWIWYSHMTKQKQATQGHMLTGQQPKQNKTTHDQTKTS